MILSAAQEAALKLERVRAVERWVLVATTLGSSMAFLDSTVVNVALPGLQLDLNATVAQMQWVVEAYTLFLAALILVGGSLGDHYGRRRVFAVGIGLFSVASAWSGLAPNADQLIYARGLQGIGGALMVPGSLAIISASFDRTRRGQAIGTWSALTSISLAIGPVLGGWLVDNLSWRWVFYINLPLAAITLGILYWRVPESFADRPPEKLDWWGALFATAGLGGLIFGLIEQINRGLSDPLVQASLVLGVICLALFVLTELRSRSPMMPLALFRSPVFSGVNLLTLLLYGALSGVLFFLPFNLIQVQGYSSTAAGASLLPFTLIMFALSRWAGGLVDRYGARLPLTVGPLITGAGFALLALPGVGGSYWTTFFPGILTVGLGMTVTVAPLTTTVMTAVEDRNAGIASGINNAIARVAGLLTIAIFGIMALSAFNLRLDLSLENLQLPSLALVELDQERTKLGGAEVPTSLSLEARQRVEAAIDRAFLAAFRLVMLVSAALAFASAGFALGLLRGTNPPKARTEP